MSLSDLKKGDEVVVFTAGRNAVDPRTDEPVPYKVAKVDHALQTIVRADHVWYDRSDGLCPTGESIRVPTEALREEVTVAPLRRLTLWPEWAHAIAWLGKGVNGVENRPWKPPAWLKGQRFAIHAGAHVGGRRGAPATREGLSAVDAMCFWADQDGIDWDDSPVPRIRRPGAEDMGDWQEVITSAIVATVVLDRVEENKGQEVPPWGSPDSKWWWHLRDVVVLAHPVACKGKLGLWKLTG